MRHGVGKPNVYIALTRVRSRKKIRLERPSACTTYLDVAEKQFSQHAPR